MCCGSSSYGLSLKNQKSKLTLVSSWAFARLSTAIAKKTFRSVSVGEQLRKILHIANTANGSSSATTTLLSPFQPWYITDKPLTPLLCRCHSQLTHFCWDQLRSTAGVGHLSVFTSTHVLVGIHSHPQDFTFISPFCLAG